MKQVVAIHGGDAYPSYQDYIAHLLTREIRIEWLLGGDWKKELQAELGDGYQVILPRLPNPQNAKYLEWKIVFEKYIPLLEDGVILIGHSMGGIFLAKYLSEETFPTKIGATFLVAAPYDMDGDRPIVEFDLPSSLTRFEQQAGPLYLFHSTDDPVVAYSEAAKYLQALPSAHLTTLGGRGHFTTADFPEIIEAIKKL